MELFEINPFVRFAQRRNYTPNYNNFVMTYDYRLFYAYGDTAEISFENYSVSLFEGQFIVIPITSCLILIWILVVSIINLLFPPVAPMNSASKIYYRNTCIIPIPLFYQEMKTRKKCYPNCAMLIQKRASIILKEILLF